MWFYQLLLGSSCMDLGYQHLKKEYNFYKFIKKNVNILIFYFIIKKNFFLTLRLIILL